MSFAEKWWAELTVRAEQALSLWPRRAASGAELKNLAELRAAIRTLPATDPRKGTASEAQWLRFADQLRECLLTQNPRGFLRWDVITQTMFAVRASYTAEELSGLRRRPDWGSRWREAIRESPIGSPTPYLRYPLSSRNLIHLAYHLSRFEEWSGQKVSDFDLVFEFGGGYGSMCRLVHNLGFRGRYIILDLPELSALQRYYLNTAGLPVRPEEATEADPPGVHCVARSEDARRLLGNLPAARHKLFVATWSLSEVKIDSRADVARMLEGFHSFLIAYQDFFSGIDNVKAFRNWISALRGIDWADEAITHLPGNHYLFGTSAHNPDPAGAEGRGTKPRAIG